MMTRIRQWYRTRGRRTRGLIRWAAPLIVVLLIVQVDWLWHRHEGVASLAEGRQLLLRVGAILAAAIAVKILFTRDWLGQDLGSVLTILGTAGLLVRIIGRWGPQPVPEWERDYIQSFLDVGAVVLLLSTVLYVIVRIVRSIARWRNRRKYSRLEFDRRRGDRRRTPEPWQGPPSDA